MNNPSNPPAFPRTAGQFIPEENACVNEAQEGMTLRDYFAAKAMSLAAAKGIVNQRDVARAAYEIADAMLLERDQKQ